MMPIILTEYGWTIPPGDWQRPIDPLTQARYVSRSSNLLVAEQIDGFIYFLVRAGEGPTTGAAGYSLLNWDYTPRSGFAAFAAAARMLTGVKGPGRCLKLTPTTWTVLFKKGSGTLAAVWDIRGTAEVFVPKPWIIARDMVGRVVKEPAGNTLTVGPSPIFIEIADPSFYRIKEIRTVEIGRGEKISFASKPLWVPSGLGASPGRYLIIGKTQEGWNAVKVNVTANLEIRSATLLWPKTAPTPQLQLKIRSNLDKPMTIQAQAKLTGAGDLKNIPVTLAPRSEAELTLPLGKLVPARRYRGYLSANQDRLPLDITLVPCMPMANHPLDMDFSTWAPFDSYYQTVKPFSEQDCSGRLMAGYDDEGLHLRVTVCDNVHRQNQGPKEMWQEDSIQIGLDLDAEKPWIANEGGCNGHFKVFEYGVALGRTGPMVWRWISYLRELPGDVEEKRVKARMVRQGDEMIYTILFPWNVLGLTGKPPAGSKIGFSLTVNDTDPNSSRHGLRLFDGMIDTKDPAGYGIMWLR